MSGYKRSPFGNNVAEGSGGNVESFVSNHYGPRKVGSTYGVAKTEGLSNQLTLDVTGTDVGNAKFTLELAPYLPAGADISKVYAKVTEAFVLGGTTPAIEIGTEGSEATNGFTITEAQAEATGLYDLTSALSGTWAAPIAAKTTIGIALSGTTPTVTSAGKIKIVVYYDIPSVS
jgi:hypothetical protein